MPYPFDQKIDLEAELNNARRLYRKYAPMCNVARQARGEAQLLLPEKQVAMLKRELNECEVGIRLATSGHNSQHDANVQKECLKSIRHYEHLGERLRDEKAQQFELDLLNYLSQKQIHELGKKLPSPVEELKLSERMTNTLRLLENKLEMATKRFCVVRNDNKKIRDEIQMLLVERESFNNQWNRTIHKLMKGKEYLMDTLEIANNIFSDREEYCKKLEVLKWKGLFQLNRDIYEMQNSEQELNHAAQVEQFLRVKGTTRVLEAEEIEEMKNEEEIRKCEEEIKHLDDLLEEVFKYVGEERVGVITTKFHQREIENFSVFMLLCEVYQESVILRRQLEDIRSKIMDRHDQNTGRSERQNRKLSELRQQLRELRTRNERRAAYSNHVEEVMARALAGINELVSLAKCDISPLLTLLGNNQTVSRYNVGKFLALLEEEIKAIVAIEYVTVKPLGSMPKLPSRLLKMASMELQNKIVGDPYYKHLIAEKIHKHVPYHPCAYCVEDYIMHLVFETPAVPADEAYIQEMFHLEPVNTDFGIFTLTVPEKRHPYRGGGFDRNTFI